MNRKTILSLALATLVGFPAIGFIIVSLFSDRSLLSAFQSATPLYLQIPIGIAYGWISAIIAWQIIRIPIFRDVSKQYQEIVQMLHLKKEDIFFISFCAGVGEEILFRGALQPFWGIWITSIVFVAIHGYLNPMNWKISIYGIYMTLVIGGLGYFTEGMGLYTAMAAHVVIDIYLLKKLSTEPLGDR